MQVCKEKKGKMSKSVMYVCVNSASGKYSQRLTFSTVYAALFQNGLN